MQESQDIDAGTLQFGWGDPTERLSFEHYPRLKAKLTDHFGSASLHVLKKSSEIDVSPSRLSADDQASIRIRFPQAELKLDSESRLRAGVGQAFRDCIRVRTNRLEALPDAVWIPSHRNQLEPFLAFCSDSRFEVIPVGGATSVVSGIQAHCGTHQRSIAIDLKRLASVVAFDEVSGVITVEAGFLGPAIEKWVSAQGFTLGHFPQSFQFSTVGGWAAARSAGQASTKYGTFADRVLAVSIVTPKGRIETPQAPNHALGPDLKSLFVGSEGIFGILDTLTLKLTRIPKADAYFGALLPSFHEGLFWAREVVQAGVRPAVIRLSDPDETSLLSHARSGAVERTPSFIGKLGEWFLRLKGMRVARPASVMIGLEGEAEEVRQLKCRLYRSIHQAGGVVIGRSVGGQWKEDRFRLPYLRDAMIDMGLFLETYETACYWNGLSGLYARVREAVDQLYPLDQRRALFLSHLSHAYEAGASLYFTLIAPLESDPLDQWQRAKEAISGAILEGGGVISHHHGMGLDHVPYHKRTELEEALLTRVKSTLDPEGILNPGKLIPRSKS